MGGQWKSPLVVCEISRLAGEERKLRGNNWSSWPDKSEQAELVASMHAREDWRSVIEVIQASQRRLLYAVGEKRLGRVVGGDAGGDDDTEASRPGKGRPHCFGEDSIGVYVSSATQRVPTGLAK
ncbi:MAG: hypothetical protein M3083_06500 [Actinomycetota bacterium]|nr:hypothetical protein [Actinomycetota bacterium]